MDNEERAVADVLKQWVDDQKNSGEVLQHDHTQHHNSQQSPPQPEPEPRPEPTLPYRLNTSGCYICPHADTGCPYTVSRDRESVALRAMKRHLNTKKHRTPEPESEREPTLPYPLSDDKLHYKCPIDGCKSKVSRKVSEYEAERTMNRHLNSKKHRNLNKNNTVQYTCDICKKTERIT
ncbi:hypothetical protein T439DRAFT_379015 [Meredithblackwellia eburnea MCA 4105]